MFDKRYSTRGIADDVDLDIQLMIWSMIDEWKSKGKKLDYLQVFDLSMETAMGKVYQKIVHYQEFPKIEETAYFKCWRPIFFKTVWVIDNGDGTAVMLFPNEY